jgi:hypothetical protein
VRARDKKWAFPFPLGNAGTPAHLLRELRWLRGLFGDVQCCGDRGTVVDGAEGHQEQEHSRTAQHTAHHVFGNVWCAVKCELHRISQHEQLASAVISFVQHRNKHRKDKGGQM